MALLSDDFAREPDHREESVEAIEELSPCHPGVCIHARMLGMRYIDLVIHVRDCRRVACRDVRENALRLLVEELGSVPSVFPPPQTTKITEEIMPTQSFCDLAGVTVMSSFSSRLA